MSKLLDIVICTYQREELLLDCISALDIQSIYPHDWGVVVVNNASATLSSKTLDTLSQHDYITVVNETSAGLSNARNCGIANSKARWLAFLDDDAKAPVDYIDQIFKIIKEESWDCFGGHIRSWWRYGKPRWLSDDYGSKPFLSKDRINLTQKHNWGSNIIIRKSSLDAIGHFPTEIGMRGYKLGYAAENIVQDRIREKGLSIGYDPNLYIDHVVMAHKLKLQWHLKSAYATGRDGKKVYPDQYGLKGMLLSFKNCISRPLKSLMFLVTHKEFYWEQAYLESVKPYYLMAGKIRSLFI